ncbi:MAG: hypothetical protein D6729_15535 [Deltaproteobacteria bacterium]|nr:MAG: hypothetical protein D6729_15535 [Deltaproteobacteria bacterium]
MSDLPAPSSAGAVPSSLFDRLLGKGPMRRVRIGALVLWLLLSCASVAAAVLLGDSNPLGAKVLLVDTGIGQAFTIQNQSDEMWHDVEFRIPGGYAYRRGAVRPGERVTVEVQAFERSGGNGPKHPPADFAPPTITIVTRDAQFTTRTRGRR